MTSSHPASPKASFHSERSVTFPSDVDDSHDFERHNHPPSPPPPKAGSPIISNKKGYKKAASFQAKMLGSNLMREQKDRNPLFHYEVISTLGVGSMGSVVKVRKRPTVAGGSARKNFQEAVRKHKRNKECLKLPCIGGIFRYCIDSELKPGAESERGSSQTGSIMSPSLRFSINSQNSVFTTSDGYGSVSVVEDSERTDSNTSHFYAMKSIHLNRITDEAFVGELKNEIAILKELDHPHIVRAIETYHHRNQIFIVTELLQGGDLYSRDPYSEEEAARVVSSILSAVSYMHSKNVAHRDLKYENIIFVDDSPQSQVKLIDFGLSKVYGDNVQLTEGVGTIYTMAPEVLRGKYSQAADLWSIGVITFMLLSSQMPFYGRKRRHIVEQILSGHFDFRGRRWKKISGQAKVFVKELLVLDPNERATANEAHSHTWLNKRFAATTRAPLAEEEDEARQAMIRYSGYTKLKKMALMVVAHKSSTDEIGILRKVFQKYDSRNDGLISYEEFSGALAESGHSQKDLATVFEAVDIDGGGIRYTEFLAATIEAQGAISEERLAEAFDRLDSDDSGFISADNLAEILGKDFPRAEIDEIIEESDLTNDNKISYSEFLALWEFKYENQREAQLRALGPPDDMFDESVRSDSFDGADGAEARASFVVAKHRPSSGKKHVIFDDSVVEIASDKVGPNDD